MALAVVAAGTTRANQPVVTARIPVSVTLSATAYVNGTGFAFDLASVLNNASAFDSHVNPLDIISCGGFSTAGYLANLFTLGTPTYAAPTDTSFGNGPLLTCPCTVRLFGTASSSGALGEVATGNVTDTVNLNLEVARGGFK